MRAQVVNGIVYEGRIDAVENGVYQVMLKDPPTRLYNCLPGAADLAPMLGLSVSRIYEIGTEVLVTAGSPAYFVCAKPNMLSDAVGKYPIDNVEEEEAIYPLGQTRNPTPMPAGLLMGEQDLSNALGVGIRLLTHLASMSASERNFIQVDLLRDLITLCADNFRHISSFGETEVLERNGRVTVEFKGATYAHESAGVIKEGDPTQEIPQLHTAGPPTAETGRWRMRAFVGYLGDLVNMIIQDPVEALGTVAQQAAGKLRVHAGQDGTLLVQSVTDIVFETVLAVPVPVQIGDPDSATEAAKMMEQSEQKYLQICEALRSTGRTDVPTLSYHLRDYARWLSMSHSWQRFLQRDTLYTIESEQAALERDRPSAACREDDKLRAGAGQEVPHIYTTIRQNRDGTITIYEGFGAGIVMSRGSIRLSATTDIEIEAARDIRMRAGGNIFMHARRNLELSCQTGGIAALAKTFLNLFSTAGGVHIRSDADPADPLTQDEQPNGDRDPRVVWQANRPAVLIEARNGGSTLFGKTSAQVVSGGASLYLGDGEPVDGATPKNLVLNGADNGSMTFRKNVMVRAERLSLAAKLIDATFSKSLTLGRRLYVTTSGIYAASRLFVSSLIARGSIEGPQIGPQVPPEAAGPNPVGLHFNHVSVNKRTSAEQAHNVPDEDLAPLPPLQASAFRPDSVPWNLMSRDEHAAIIPPRSMAQAAAADTPQDFNIVTADQLVVEAPNMGDNRAPFVGPVNKEWVLESQLDPLHKACSVPPAEIQDKSAGKMSVQTAEFRYYP